MAPQPISKVKQHWARLSTWMGDRDKPMQLGYRQDGFSLLTKCCWLGNNGNIIFVIQALSEGAWASEGLRIFIQRPKHDNSL